VLITNNPLAALEMCCKQIWRCKRPLPLAPCRTSHKYSCNHSIWRQISYVYHTQPWTHCL